VTDLAAPRRDLLRRGLQLEYLTVGWNIAEGLIAVGAGLAAGSIALIGFGIDSFVETISGAVLIWRLAAEARGRLDEDAVEQVERRAERLVGVAFLLLAAYVGFEAVRSLVGQEMPDASPVGVALTAVSIVVICGSPARNGAWVWPSAAAPSSPTRSRRMPAGTCRSSRSSGSDSTPPSVCGGQTRWPPSASWSSLCARASKPSGARMTTDFTAGGRDQIRETRPRA
jgi:hypothetical protein